MAAAGVVIMGCAVAAFLAALWSSTLVVRGTELFGWSTIPALWPLLSAVLVASVILLISPRYARAAGVVTLLCAVQLVGGGFVASRDWLNTWGASGFDTQALALVLPLTMMLVIAMTVAGAVAVALLWHPAMRWRPERFRWLVAGVLIAVLLPAALIPLAGTELTIIGQVTLTWSLPWGFGIAVGGWLEKPLRKIAAATVAASVILTPAIMVTWALSWAALHLSNAVGRDALMLGVVAVLSAWAAVAHLMWRRERRVS